jgi:5'-nucleotidase
VTSRGAPSERRLLTTLESLGIQAAELFLLDGMKKEKILQTLKPHIFFDDQLRHIEQTAGLIPSVLIPFGVRNS